MFTRKVGIVDVAKAAGVSNAAASYALNGKERVSEKTRAKVLKVAAELGYIANGSAVLLRTGRSNLFGAIVNDITNPFFAELMAEFENAAWAGGFMTIIATSQDDAQRQSHLIKSMLSQGVAGVIISPVPGTTPDDFKPFHDNALPFIVCVREIEKFEHHFIGADDLMAGEIAAQHILENGHRRVGFIGGYEHTSTWKMRAAGIRQKASSMGIKDFSMQIVSGGEGNEFGCHAVLDLLAQENPPTAFIGLNDDTANGAYLAAARLGLQIGQDLSVIGFDNIPQSKTLLPGLTTVEMFPRMQGKASAEQLISVLGQSAKFTQQTRFSPALIVRNSVARV